MPVKNTYIVTTYFQKVKNKKTSNQAGNLQVEDNTFYDEAFDIVNKVKTKDLQTASIILDLNSKKIVKNNFNKAATFDDLFKYFFIAYERAVSVIMEEIDKDYVNSVREKILKEMEDIESKKNAETDNVQPV